MDIRCERCETEYEFDESKVTEAGVTVKCVNCGNLFRIRRRSAPQAAPSPSAQAEKIWRVRDAAGQVREFKELSTLQAWIRENKVTPEHEISRTGETWKRLGDISELASLFQILEKEREQRAIVEADALQLPTARLGSVQAPLGPVSTAPLGQVTVAPGPEEVTTTPTTRYGTTDETSGIVEVAATATASPPGGVPAVAQEPPQPSAAQASAHASAPLAGALDRPTGPVAIGSAPVGEEPAFVGVPLPEGAELSGPAWDVSDARTGVKAPEEALLEGAPPRSRRRGLVVVTALVAALVLGILGARNFTAIRGLFSKGSAKGEETYRLGRELFLLDTDETFERAKALFNQADAADEESSLGLSALAEMQATQALYILDDIKLAEKTGSGDQASASVARRKAYDLLEEAQRNAIEASRRPGATEVPEVQRAWAAIRLAQGNPPQAVEADLAKVRQARPDDAEALFVEGALRLREGQTDRARQLLSQAAEASKSKTNRTLLRAQYLLARLEFDQGRVAEARRHLQEIIAINERHLRARRLLDLCEKGLLAARQASGGVAATAAPGLDAGVALADTKASAKQPEGAPLPGGGEKAGATKGEPGEPLGGTYDALVLRGEKLQRTGASAQAQRLFEKALEQRPGGVEALTGLAYCYLDANRFQAAISTFQKALAQSPRYGEAVIGLAEAFKMVGDKGRALEHYRRYLEIGGPRRIEAERNARELEPAVRQAGHGETKAPIEAVKPPAPAPAPPEEKPAPHKEKPEEKPTPAPKEKPDEKPAPAPKDKPAAPEEERAPQGASPAP